MYSTAANVNFIRSVVRIAGNLFGLSSLLCKTGVSKLAGIADEKNWQGTRRTYFCEKRAGLFQREYAVCDGPAGASKFLKAVLNPLEQRAALQVAPLPTMLDLVVSTFPREEVLKEEEKRRLCNPVVIQSV